MKSRKIDYSNLQNASTQALVHDLSMLNEQKHLGAERHYKKALKNAIEKRTDALSAKISALKLITPSPETQGHVIEAQAAIGDVMVSTRDKVANVFNPALNDPAVMANAMGGNGSRRQPLEGPDEEDAKFCQELKAGSADIAALPEEILQEFQQQEREISQLEEELALAKAA